MGPVKTRRKCHNWKPRHRFVFNIYIIYQYLLKTLLISFSQSCAKVFGLNPRASMTKEWGRFHQNGKDHVRITQKKEFFAIGKSISTDAILDKFDTKIH